MKHLRRRVLGGRPERLGGACVRRRTPIRAQAAQTDSSEATTPARTAWGGTWGSGETEDMDEPVGGPGQPVERARSGPCEPRYTPGREGVRLFESFGC
jgi:hypothetical protein